MLNIIKGNFEISKQKLPELKKEINELRQSIEHAENALEDRVAPVEEKLRNIESRIQLLLKITKTNLPQRPIQKKQLKHRWHQRETK